METTIKIQHKDDKTVLSTNVVGQEWCFDKLDDETAIASVLYYTVKNYFKRTQIFSSDFEIKISMEITYNDGQ